MTTHGTCDRCKKPGEEIKSDEHGSLLCAACLCELDFKRKTKRLAFKFPKCVTCGKAKSRDEFNSDQLEKWDALRYDRMEFGKRVVFVPEIKCSTCETLQMQTKIAKSAVADLNMKSIRWWRRGTKLTEKDLTDEMIETKTTQLKVSNLWQTPKT